MTSAWFALTASLTLAPTLAAQTFITVTLYDVAGLRPEIRQALKNEAARILLQAGIRVTWIDCEVAGQPVNLSACALPLGPNRFMLQLMPGRNPKNPLSSGMATIRKGSSVFAYLYPDRLRDLSRDANWIFADLLGHAAAHELGHLLLDSSAHDNAGIMRARWETEDLRRLSHDGLVFSSGQLAAVRARLETSVE